MMNDAPHIHHSSLIIHHSSFPQNHTQLRRFDLKAARILILPGLLLAFTVSLSAQDLASFEKRTTVKKLDNGLTVIVMERPEAPVFSFATMVNVGAAQEVPGITGLAHMFEHMAFKGTDKIGTTDYAAEQAALQKVEETYAAY